jgi:Fic family protein
MNKRPFDRNEPYNELPLLPPDNIWETADVLKKWGHAARALASLNKNILRLPNPSMLVNTLSLQEAKSSTAIENIFTTDDELYKAVSDTVTEESSNPNTKEVLRYREALWTGYAELTKKRKIEKSTIISIHQKIKNTKQGIRPPQSQTIIRRGNSELRPGEVIYTPPREKSVLEKLMDNIVDYLNSKDAGETDPIIKMAIAHYQFEAIHPFTDGNGRTGRILNLLYLVHQNLLSHPVLYLSKYIINHKDDYYHHLAGVTQRNDWKSWILYMLTAVEQTALSTNQTIDDIIAQMDATYFYARKNLKWYTKEINEQLFSQPYVRSRTITHLMQSSSRTTGVKYANDLVKLGVFSKKGEGREVYYVNNDLIRILEG